MILDIWIILKSMRVKRGGKLLLLKPGDKVPEAAEWPNREHWVARGYIKNIKVEITQDILDAALDAETSPKQRKRKAG